MVSAGSAVGGKPYEVIDDRPPARCPAGSRALLTRKPDPRRRAARQSARRPAPRLAETVRGSQPGDRTGPLVWARTESGDGHGREADPMEAGELLVQAAVEPGIRGGERYARQQVRHVLGGER